MTKLRPWESWTEGPQATTCVWIQRRSSTALPGGGHDDPSPSLSSALAQCVLVLVLEGGGVPPILGTTGEPFASCCSWRRHRSGARVDAVIGEAGQRLPPRGPGDAIESRWLSACSLQPGLHGATGRPLASPALSSPRSTKKKGSRLPESNQRPKDNSNEGVTPLGQTKNAYSPPL